MAENRCVCCGGIIPEGLLACPNCLVVSKKEKKMTVKQAFDSIVEDGIALGAGDFVDPEALEVAAVILAKLLRGHLVEVVRCKDCVQWQRHSTTVGVCPHGMCHTHDIEMEEDDFCSYGERRTK